MLREGLQAVACWILHSSHGGTALPRLEMTWWLIENTLSSTQGSRTKEGWLIHVRGEVGGDNACNGSGELRDEHLVVRAGCERDVWKAEQRCFNEGRGRKSSN